MIKHPRSGLAEDSFEYMKRHTLGRPRDLVILTSELSNNQQDLSETLYRELIGEVSSAVLVSNVFEEMRVFLECLGNRSERLRFLALLPGNILTRDEMIAVYCAFNEIDMASFAEGDSPSACSVHPFWELYSAGLLGVVIDDSQKRNAVQRFKQPTDLTENCPSGLPTSRFYLVHPSLSALVREHRSSGAYRVFQHILVGHGLPWTHYYDELHAIETVFSQIADQDLCNLAYDVLSDVTHRSNTSEAREISAALLDSTSWEKLTLRAALTGRNDVPALLRAFGTNEVTLPRT